MEHLIAKKEFFVVGAKTTVCLLTLINGFEIIGTSACVDPRHFVRETGEIWALKDAMNQLEKYDGYMRQFEWRYSRNDNDKGMNFGQALEALKNGKKLARAGWNGKGMWLLLQRPDERSKMTLPYVYIEYPAGHPAYPSGSRVPWLASQTDMLSEDWEIID